MVGTPGRMRGRGIVVVGADVVVGAAVVVVVVGAAVVVVVVKHGPALIQSPKIAPLIVAAGVVGKVVAKLV